MADLGTAYIRVAPNMTGIQGKISSGLKGSGSKFAEQFGGEINSKGAVIMGALAGIASAATNKAMSMITNSVGAAIKRVDTLNNSAKTFEYMGFAASDSKRATDALTKSIQGLPTPLDGAMRGMTALAATYGDVNLGQKVFTSLNNAILGFGGSAAMVENAITQVSQLPLDGPLDAQTWNSLRNSGLTPVLNAMAKDSGMGMAAMKEAFGKGELTVQDFTNKLISMNEKGGGGLVALEKIAKNATSGIGTGLDNMQTAVVRGVANIIQAIGAANISSAISSIGAAFEKVLKIIATGIPPAISAIQGFIGFIARNKDVFAPLAVGIGAVVTAITAWKTATLLWSKATKAAKAVQAAFNAVAAMNPMTLIALAIIGVVAALTYFFTQTEKGRALFASFAKFMQGVWAGIQSGLQSVGSFFVSTWNNIKGAVDTVTNAITTAYNAVSNFVTGAINVLITAVQTAVKWIYDWRQWFINIGIVVGTILLPKLIQLGIEAVKAGAQWALAMAKAAGAAIKAGLQAGVAFVKMGLESAKNAVIAGAAWVKQAALAAGAWLKQLPKLILATAKAAVASAKNAVIAGAAWIKQAGLTLASWAKTFLAYGLGVAKAALTTGLAAVKMAASWLLAMGPIGLIVAAVAGAVALIIANWDTVKRVASAVWQGIQAAVSAVIGWIKTNWPLILAIITGPIGLAVLAIIKNWDTIKAAFVTAWTFIKNTWNAAIGWFGNVWNGIKNVFSSVGGWFRNIFQTAWNGITGIFGKIGGWFKDRFNDIKNAFTNIGEVGKDIVKGLWNGISNMGNWLKDKLISFVKDKIPGPIKKALGIHSPSKVAAGLGKEVPAGLAQGITQKAGLVTRAATDMAQNAIVGMARSTMSAEVSANMRQSGSVSASAPAPAVATGTQITQNNNVYNQVDLDSVTRDLAWQVRR